MVAAFITALIRRYRIHPAESLMMSVLLYHMLNRSRGCAAAGAVSMKSTAKGYCWMLASRSFWSRLWSETLPLP